MTATPVRINAAEARAKVRADEAILVCAYDDEEKCKKIHVDGAYTMQTFRDRLDDISSRTEVIFYCA